MNTSVTVQLVKAGLILGVLVLPVACASTAQLESLKKEMADNVVASQAEQREHTAAQVQKIQGDLEARIEKVREEVVQKTQEDLEARIEQVRVEVAQKTEAQEKQMVSWMEYLRKEFNVVRERFRQLQQIEAEVSEIQNQTRYIQTEFKDNLRGQASLLREELEMVEKTLKGMERPIAMEPSTVKAP